jgi:hypothetical protein
MQAHRNTAAQTLNADLIEGQAHACRRYSYEELPSPAYRAGVHPPASAAHLRHYGRASSDRGRDSVSRGSPPHSWYRGGPSSAKRPRRYTRAVLDSASVMSCGQLDACPYLSNTVRNITWSNSLGYEVCLAQDGWNLCDIPCHIHGGEHRMFCQQGGDAVCLCRSAEGPDGRFDAEDLSREDLLRDSLQKAQQEISATRAEAEEAQRDRSQLQLQLEELTEQANSKLSDQRSKMKHSKRRSQQRCLSSELQRMLCEAKFELCSAVKMSHAARQHAVDFDTAAIYRGKHLMNLVAAAKQIQACEEAVTSAQQALADAKAHLLSILSEAQGYIISEQAEDEAEDKERAAVEATRAAPRPEAATRTAGAAFVSVDDEPTAAPASGNSGLALKPFKITLNQT